MKRKIIKAFLCTSTLIAAGYFTSACHNSVELDIPTPSVNKITFTHLAVGDSIELRGENIHLITSVSFDGVTDQNISLDLGKRSRTSLKVAVPSFSKDSLLNRIEAIFNSRHSILLGSNVQVVLVPRVHEWTQQVSVGATIELRGISLLKAKEVRLGNTLLTPASRNDMLLTIAATAEMVGTHSITLLYDNVLGTDQIEEVGQIVITP